MYTALEIAVWFLGAIDRRAGDGITHLKLQKLVYYAQAWSLALLDRPLFDEEVEAWAHGPVVETVFQRFKDAGWENLPRLARKTEIDPQTILLLRGVLATYGEHTARSSKTSRTGRRLGRARAKACLPPAGAGA
jgi:uncharacterized phage-associated protein